MQNPKSNNFFECIKWFNNFASQLNLLYDKIRDCLNTLKLKEKNKRYTNYSPTSPRIPDLFHMGLVPARKEKFSIDIISIFNDEYLSKEELFKRSPSIFIMRTEKDSGYFTDRMMKIFLDDGLHINKDNDFFECKIDDLGNVKGFQIELEEFNNRNIEDVINREIIPKVKMLLENS